MRILTRLVFEEYALGVYIVNDFSEAPLEGMALHHGLPGTLDLLVVDMVIAYADAATYGRQ